MFYVSPVVMTAKGDGYQRYSTPYAAGIIMATIYGPPRMGPRARHRAEKMCYLGHSRVASTAIPDQQRPPGTSWDLLKAFRLLKPTIWGLSIFRHRA